MLPIGSIQPPPPGPSDLDLCDALHHEHPLKERRALLVLHGRALRRLVDWMRRQPTGYVIEIARLERLMDQLVDTILVIDDHLARERAS